MNLRPMTAPYQGQPTTRIEPPSLLDPSFTYCHSTKTNVQNTWRRFGWTPPCRETQAQVRLQLNRLN